MKILVTGGAGFIGSHITNFFLSMNYSVTVLDNFSTGNKENLDIRPNLELVEGSITNYQLVDTIMSRVDICFHLAAAVGVKNIVDNPIISFETNVIGSEIVLKSASRYGVRTILTSSSEIYGKNPKQPLTENSDRVLGSPQVDRWSYSDAKAIDEFLANYFFRSEKFPVTIVRLFNIVGPCQLGKYGMVLPRFISAAIHGEPLTIYGNGKQSRTFLAISDLLEAFLKILNTESTIGEVFNIGGRELTTIEELAKKTIRIANSKSTLVYKNFQEVFGDNFEEPLVRVPDISKISQAVGWYPSKSLEHIIEELVNLENRSLNLK